jgi:hypothetical protein
MFQVVMTPLSSDNQLSQQWHSASFACKPQEYYCLEETCTSRFVVTSAIERYPCTKILDLSYIRKMRIKISIIIVLRAVLMGDIVDFSN